MNNCTIIYHDHTGKLRKRSMPWPLCLDLAFVHLLLDDLTNIVALRSNQVAKQKRK